MNTEPTLSDLEDQAPTAGEELRNRIHGIGADLGSVRMVMRTLKQQEQELLEERNALRLQLRVLTNSSETIRAELTLEPSRQGTFEPICPDCSPNDG